MRREVVAPAPVPRDLPLSPAIRHGDTLYVSAQLAPEAGDVTAQTRAVLQKIAAIVEAGGGDLRSVLRCNVYLADIGTFAQMNAVYRELFPVDPPARTTIECRMTRPEILVEIDCIAAVTRPIRSGGAPSA